MYHHQPNSPMEARGTGRLVPYARGHLSYDVGGVFILEL